MSLIALLTGMMVVPEPGVVTAAPVEDLIGQPVAFAAASTFAASR